MSPLQISAAPWKMPLSLPGWRELWRISSGRSPVPVVLDLPREEEIVPMARWAEELRQTHRTLVAGGYAEWAGATARPTRVARDMLRVLARPHREVDLRMEIRGEPVRVLAAAPLRGDVVRVSIHASLVSIESVATGAPELAAVDVLPQPLGTGRIRALSIPVADLERAIAGQRSNHFIDALVDNIGRAAGEVYDLLRRGHTLRAKFGVAARDRDGNRARDPFAVVVHDSTAGRHVLVRRDTHITIDRADNRQIMAMLGQRLDAAAGGRG
jgi:hypothetical protein